MKLNDIYMALDKMTFEEVRAVNKYAYSLIDAARKDMKYNFRRGDKVTFYARGMFFSGTVTGLLTKNVAVTDQFGSRWRVSPTILKKVEEKVPA